MSAAEQRPVDWKLHAERRRELAARHPLRYLFLEVTRRCNLSCAYCGSECTRRARRREMGTEGWLRAIRQVAEDFDPKEVMIAVTGGEPLLRPDIFEIFAELRAHGFPFGMVSNGTVIRRTMARRIAESGIGSISLSLDAPDAINDELRGEGAAAKVERAIGALRQADYKGKLEIISTITRPVIPHLAAMRRRVARLRVPEWRMAPVMPIGRAAGRADLLLSPAEVKVLLDFLVAARRDGLKPVPSFSEEGFLGDEYEGVVRPYLYRCNAGITIAGILWDGRIGACPELAECFVQGHIEKDRFSEVWRTGYGQLRDRSWACHGACDGCQVWEPCAGGALHLYRDMSSSPLRCFHLMLGPPG